MKELNMFLDNKLPIALEFGGKVILAIVVFIIGRKVIKGIRKVVRKSMEHTS